MNFLFLCSMNRLRSPTAETIFSELAHIEVDSAGINRGAEVRLSADQLEAADIIFCMEKMHKRKLNESYGKYLKGKRVVVLNIPDNYPYMDEDLINLLRRKCMPYF